MQTVQIKTFIPEDHKIKALIYGPAGAGKTVFAGTAKKAIYASAEGGLLSIADKKPEFVEIKSLKDLLGLYSFLSNEDHEYETVVIDSITEINEIIKSEIEKRTGRALQLQDWGEVASKVSNVLRAFRDLPMNVLFIAQENYINDEQKIKKIVPELNGKSATSIARYMDVVGYIHVEADGTRWIETTTNRNLLTKDRTQKIGNDTTLDFSEWQERAATIKTGKQEIKTEYKPIPDEIEQKPAPKKAVAETSHLTNLKKELLNRGATNAEDALRILNELLPKGSAAIESLEIDEKTASKLLIQILQAPKKADEPKKEVKKAEPSVYSDIAKVKKMLDGLTTVNEVAGLRSEIIAAFDAGDMTKSVHEELVDLCERKMAEINDGLLKPKRKSVKSAK